MIICIILHIFLKLPTSNFGITEFNNESMLKLIDLALVMSVNPGFGGQKFIKSTLKKALKLRKEIDQKKLKVLIEMDGGINFDNVQLVKKAGVDIIVSGTTIFKQNNGNIKKNIKVLKTS